MNSVIFEKWELFPFNESELIEKYSGINDARISGDDEERILNKDPAVVLVGQKVFKNHTYRIYFDAAYGIINRHILTIDDKWVQVMENFSSLMAFADYAADREDDVEKLLNGEILQISWFEGL